MRQHFDVWWKVKEFNPSMHKCPRIEKDLKQFECAAHELVSESAASNSKLVSESAAGNSKAGQ